MESKQNTEPLNVAIQKLLDEKRKHDNPDDNSLVGTEDDGLLVSRLLSEKQEGRIKGGHEDEAPLNPSAGEPKSGIQNEDGMEKAGRNREVMAGEEIIKELRHVRRQNTITHCLLSIMIVLTVGWQLSEVSLILKVKEGVSHPFRCLGSMVTGMFKPKVAATTDRNGDRDSNGEPTMMSNFSQTEHPQLPQLKMPELPHFAIPENGVNRKND